MSHWLEQFFQRRTDGGLILRNGASCHHQTSQGLYVYPDRFTVLDNFHMIETMVAKYTIVCESQKDRPHKLDTFELTILANRDNVVFTVYGRVFTDRKLVDIAIEQYNSLVYLKVKEINYGDSDRVKVSLIRNYIDASGTS
jgi:hypothetical protein